MAAAASSSGDYGSHVPLRRRLASLSIALLVNILILLGLFQIAPTLPGQKPDEELATFDLAPPVVDKPSSPEPAHQPKPAAKSAPPQPAAIKPAIAPAIEPLALPALKLPSNPMSLSSGEPTASLALGDGAGNGAAGAGDSGAGGDGTGSSPLYKAEWVREPSHDDLAFYVHGRAPKGGSAHIACQTAPNFRVKYCRPLAESPSGSGLARAVIAASWKFRVRPPLVDGKAVIGAWVGIPFTFDAPSDGR